MTYEEALQRFRARYERACAIELADVEERIALMLGDREGIEVRVMRLDIVRVFVRKGSGDWSSGYAWTLRHGESRLRMMLRT